MCNGDSLRSSLTHARRRVLNLAGNNIATVENIGHLQSLTELNLRRNKIAQVFELNMLPNLQRVFLSNNSLEQFEDASCVFKIKFLLELALDGNPMAEAMEQRYAADSGIIISKVRASEEQGDERRRRVFGCQP